MDDLSLAKPVVTDKPVRGRQLMTKVVPTDLFESISSKGPLEPETTEDKERSSTGVLYHEGYVNGKLYLVPDKTLELMKDLVNYKMRQKKSTRYKHQTSFEISDYDNFKDKLNSVLQKLEGMESLSTDEEESDDEKTETKDMITDADFKRVVEALGRDEEDEEKTETNDGISEADLKKDMDALDEGEGDREEADSKDAKLIDKLNYSNGQSKRLDKHLTIPNGQVTSFDKHTTPSGESEKLHKYSASNGQAKSLDKKTSPIELAKAFDEKSIPYEQAKAFDEKTSPYEQAKAFDEKTTSFEQAKAFDGKSTPYEQAKAFDGKSTPYERAKAFDDKTTPYEQAKAFDDKTSPFELAKAFDEKSAPYERAKAFDDKTTPFEQAKAFDEKTTPYEQAKAFDDKTTPYEQAKAFNKKRTPYEQVKLLDRKITPLILAKPQIEPAKRQFMPDILEGSEIKIPGETKRIRFLISGHLNSGQTPMYIIQEYDGPSLLDGQDDFCSSNIGEKVNVFISGRFFNKNILEECQGKPIALNTDNKRILIDENKCEIFNNFNKVYKFNGADIHIKGNFIKSEVSNFVTPFLSLRVKKHVLDKNKAFKPTRVDIKNSDTLVRKTDNQGQNEGSDSSKKASTTILLYKPKCDNPFFKNDLPQDHIICNSLERFNNKHPVISSIYHDLPSTPSGQKEKEFNKFKNHRKLLRGKRHSTIVGPAVIKRQSTHSIKDENQNKKRFFCAHKINSSGDENSK